MSPKEEIVSLINEISGAYSPYQVFYDYVKMSALAISNSVEMFHNNIWRDREKQYTDVATRYSPEQIEKFSRMFQLIFDAFEEKISDHLGEIYMQSGAGQSQLGQFFTPYHLSKMSAAIALGAQESGDKIILNEPSCGAGGMIIGAADILQERGVNYQPLMQVVAQDLDWLAVYMCYIQLSVLGIDAIVVQGDSLLHPYQKGVTPEIHILRTPKNKGALI